MRRSVRRGTAVLAVLVLVLAAAGVAAWLLLRDDSSSEPERAARPTRPAPAQTFASRPGLRPPVVTVLTPAKRTAPGYVFIAPKRAVVQTGLLILDNQGDVVWFRPLGKRGVADFRPQRYRGRPVLTWWEGAAPVQGIGQGSYAILDSSYRRIATVTAGNGLTGDIHEFIITPRDTALITIYNRIPWDLSPLGGPKEGAIQEGVVQELDIATGRVLFEWHSAEHVAPAESYSPVPPPARGSKSPYDYFHINSVDIDDDGGFIVSARNTNAIYKIRRSDGAVLWRLGGKRSDFRLGRGVRFAWQHDARRQRDGTLTLFDNATDEEKKGPFSRALVLRLDARTRRASVVRSYVHPRRLRSTSQGNAQFLENGNVLVGWGSNPYVTEFDRAGRVLFDARFAPRPGADSYRAYRAVWTGLPTDRPAIALETGRGGRRVVRVSWNGATEVARWRVLAGNTTAGLTPVATVAKSGFETAVPVDATARYYSVEALSRRGRVLRAARAVRALAPAGAQSGSGQTLGGARESGEARRSSE